MERRDYAILTVRAKDLPKVAGRLAKVLQREAGWPASRVRSRVQRTEEHNDSGPPPADPPEWIPVTLGTIDGLPDGGSLAFRCEYGDGFSGCTLECASAEGREALLRAWREVLADGAGSLQWLEDPTLPREWLPIREETRAVCAEILPTLTGIAWQESFLGQRYAYRLLSRPVRRERRGAVLIGPLPHGNGMRRAHVTLARAVLDPDALLAVVSGRQEAACERVACEEITELPLPTTRSTRRVVAECWASGGWRVRLFREKRSTTIVQTLVQALHGGSRALFLDRGAVLGSLLVCADTDAIAEEIHARAREAFP